jgi:hypothetical protein
MNRPRCTQKVIEGIIVATSAHFAGDISSAFGMENAETREAWEHMGRADQWARDMREWMRENGTWNEESNT